MIKISAMECDLQNVYQKYLSSILFPVQCVGTFRLKTVEINHIKNARTRPFQAI